MLFLTSIKLHTGVHYPAVFELLEDLFNCKVNSSPFTQVYDFTLNPHSMKIHSLDALDLISPFLYLVSHNIIWSAQMYVQMYVHKCCLFLYTVNYTESLVFTSKEQTNKQTNPHNPHVEVKLDILMVVASLYLCSKVLQFMSEGSVSDLLVHGHINPHNIDLI